MLLIIHNLPPHMRYADVKSLIAKCGFDEVILDKLESDGRNSQKVTVGLPAEEDAAILARHINGLFVEGRKLSVEDVREKKMPKQFHQSYNNYETQSSDVQSCYNQQSDYPPQMNYQQAQYPNQMHDQQFANPQLAMPMMMPYMGNMNMGGMYMPQGPHFPQNPMMDYTGQMQQYPSLAAQYTPYSGQQDQSRSGPDRRVQLQLDHEDDSHSHSNDYTYKPDTRQSEWTGRGGSDVGTSRRRSRSPRNKRDRSQDRGGFSPKRLRIEVYNRDAYDKSSSTYNRDEYNTTQTYDSSNRNDSYTSKNYGNNKKFEQYYNNDPVTAQLSNKQSNPSAPSQNPWNSGTKYNPTFQRETGRRFSDSNSFEDKSQVARSQDLKSNYREHMEKIASQSESKCDWRNPAQTSWYNPDTTSGAGRSRSQYSWKKPDVGENEKTNKPYGDQRRAPVKDKPVLGRNQIHEKEMPGSSFGKHQPIKSTPPPFHHQGETNYPNKWAKKPNKKAFTKPKKSLLPSIKQDSIARHKASVEIASAISKAHPDIMKKHYFKYLRQSVRSRLEILLVERLGVSVPQMVAIYGAKFPQSEHRHFCNLVVEQIPPEIKTKGEEKDSDVKIEGVKKDMPSPQVNKNTQPISGQVQPADIKNQPAVSTKKSAVGKNQPAVGKNKPVGKNQSASGKNKPGNSQNPVLPRLPDPMAKLARIPTAKKLIFKEQKKLKKLEHQNEDLYKLPPPLAQALEDELKIISDIFKTVVSNADSEQEKGLCERFLSVGLDQVRKVIKLNATKRLLNINSNLIIRVLTSGKPPKRPEVELFLKQQNVVSVKKSDRKKLIYIATCIDFETYDRLLQMGSTPLNDETILRFKPFQLVGPKLSLRERNELRRQRFMGEENKANDFSADPTIEDFADLSNEVVEDYQEGSNMQDDQQGDDLADCEDTQNKDGQHEDCNIPDHEEMQHTDGQYGDSDLAGHKKGQETEGQQRDRDLEERQDTHGQLDEERQNTDGHLDDCEYNEDDLEDY